MPGQKRRLVPEDLYRFVTVSDPQISPDGEVIAFVRTHIDPESKERRSHIWMVPAAGGRPAPFTQGPKNDSSPRWSPDGQTLAFVSDRGGDRQIWLIGRHGGEAWQLTQMRHGASNPVWSPDGRYIAFTSAVGPEDKRELLTRAKSEADKKAEEKRAKDEARTFTAMRWRDDATGIKPDRKAQIWVVPVPAPGDPQPKPVQVTWGYFDHGGAEWSPDGRFLAFGANRTEDESFRIRDIFVVPVPHEGSPAARASVAPPAPGAAEPGEEEKKALAEQLQKAAEEAEAAFRPVNITGSIGAFYGARFSPDGTTLAVIGHQNEYHNATQPKIYLYPAGGGEPRILDHYDLQFFDSVGADVRPGGNGVEVTWSPDGHWIYVPVVERGACSVYAFPVSGDRPQRLVGGQREISGGTFDRQGQRLAFVAGSMFEISDLHVYEVATGEERRLTAVNEELFAGIEWPEVQELNFKARDGWDLHGWLMKPVGFREGQKYPLVLEIHGGPHTCFGYAFYQEMQLLAAAGYGVLFINPRGSTSYGQAFVDAVRGDYGNRDYKDLMDAVDHALTFGWVDEKRLAVTGGSYGGFMTNWIVTQTDRFAAAITHRSISNWVSFSGTPDFGPFFNQIQHKVEDPWSPEGVQELWRISPLAYVKNVKTPICIMHSEFDYRCPIEQAEQFYMAIKFYGQAPTELVRHPRSNHDLTRQGPPALRVDRFHKMLRWFGKYCPAATA
ncbi:dipeptidyl aminopeptidase/acylaminoacyl peptidase [Symbiobacterium terraclitae]|uniref:Dipeptidyl aminopeptidase/acylaminoacyl peptidase n=1 Tax=Symbiobacterium terraclitae TaxID=557451 RepID=A0ABS4JVD9_9FIRM|nr:S9 family peptidase [Symbiobacterium terraclitae]MBP2019529.1 dipeptidyl aminopeptidase/acylaminoacyl peptidase [Symbiobacterium terraclitae]